MTLGERILEYRAKHDMSQADFANKCHVNVMTVSTVEHGKHKPTALTRAKIERVLEAIDND